MKLGFGVLVMLGALILATVTHSFWFGVVGFVALFVGWKTATTR